MTESFFTLEEETRGKAYRSNLRACGACKLCKTTKNPKRKAQGDCANGIMVVGRSPNEQNPWYFEYYDVDIDEAVYMWSVACNPPRGKFPEKSQITHCQPGIRKAIKKYKPDIIFPMGRQALDAVLPNKPSNGIDTYRGWCIPSFEYNAWVCPVYHADRVDDNEKKFRGVTELVLEEDLGYALDLPPFEDNEIIRIDDMDIELFTSPGKIRKFLDHITDVDYPVAFDYETSGIKPYAEGHFIKFVSVSDELGHAVAFEMVEDVEDEWIEFLESDTPKIAHNIKFETQWSKIILDADVNNWLHDTMLMAHYLDNRSGICGLKFQAFVRYGELGYDDCMKPYFETEDKKNPNLINNIDSCPLKVGGHYCGVDSALTLMLDEDQQGELE